MLIIIFLYELIRSIVANAKIRFAYFIHLHIVKIREIRNVKTVTKRRKRSFFLKSCLDI